MSLPAVRPVARRGVAGEAADRIRDAILSGELAAGTALKEVELASRLGVSRGSVREGLVLLEGEGLVVSEWHRGTWVRALDPEDVEEIYTLRTALDVLAMRTAAVKARNFDALDAVVGAMKLARTDAERVALDIEFHDAVYAATGHRRLVEAWQAIRSQVHLFLLARIVGDPSYQDNVVPEHAGLVAVLRSGDAAKAGRVAEEHLRGSYAKLVEQR
ncbi:DNA-binding transcriptional regulator, GntR family [Lentzea waywayandensis]|uniref:DNA-binding transcriptional regulator, GntR family n=1 Tax=Lentzea waywayandensis TaxID=84724 RepID=A0A1I6FF69_9PSEU|nr:GntR family transcriptional regulator [Lentzea waywayandensis]SFR28599.1 DNA-binding transcriptional regulator, GntR family [Lentzea waywayandensis]